jgi:hypothetical protein
MHTKLEAVYDLMQGQRNIDHLQITHVHVFSLNKNTHTCAAAHARAVQIWTVAMCRPHARTCARIKLHFPEENYAM